MRISLLIAAFLLLFGAFTTPCSAQITVRDTTIPTTSPTTSATANAGQQATDPSQSLAVLQYRGNFQLGLTLVVTVFGFACLLVVVWLFRPSVAADAEKVARVVIVVVVVSASLVLITGGYSNEQIAPAFGLFGTMVGYILGSAGRRTNAEEDEALKKSAAGGDKTKLPPNDPKKSGQTG